MKVNDCEIIEVETCKKEDLVVEVAKKLDELGIRHMVVMDNNNSPVGVVSVTDISNKVVAKENNPNEVKTEEIMNSPIFIVDHEDDAGKAYYGMVERNIFFCPVLKENKMKGIVTFHEITKKITFPKE